ncbi:MAG: hypothetical protein U0796_08060 [Gemmatales bacterium]
MRRTGWMCLLALGLCLSFAVEAYAQPSRQLPGVRAFLGQTVPQPPLNSRRRPAASQVGMESTDFYPKNGYPKVLGDAVESGAAQAGGAAAAGNAAAAGAAGNNGVTGVQAAGSMGFQGNSGNQIGQNGGGTILGGIFGGGGGAQGFKAGQGPAMGITGGGFSGFVPKGFGFGGSPVQ